MAAQRPVGSGYATVRPRLPDVRLGGSTQEDEELGLSSLMIAGRERLGSSFRAEAEELAHRLDTYLAATSAARTLEEWCAAVDQLADLALATDRPVQR